jgi:N-succinyl-L-ornithine transcarbamylase
MIDRDEDDKKETEQLLVSKIHTLIKNNLQNTKDFQSMYERKAGPFFSAVKRAIHISMHTDNDKPAVLKRVLGSYFDILAIRAFPSLTQKEEDVTDFVLHQFIKYCKIPVISLESAIRHPLQSLADQLTIQEFATSKKNPKVVLTWAPHIKAIPHAVANSFAEWTLGMRHDLTICHPEGYELDPEFTQGATLTNDQSEALQDADFVYVKNWSAFNDYGKILCTDERWMLTETHLKHAPEAKVMHCLPVRRNIELSDEILDGPRSLVQQQAFNRVFAAQAVLSKLLE